jgi:hypothetical protein
MPREMIVHVFSRPARSGVHPLHEVFSMRRLLFAVVLVAVASPALARSNHSSHSGQDRVSVFGRDVTVAEEDTAGDIACVFCTVHIHGAVRGDVAVLFGNVTVDEGRNIAGDVAILGGDLRLGEGAAVGGDVAIAAGNANLASGATIHGQQAVLPGRVWLLAPLAPLLILAGLIWLVVWIVRRNRYQFPAYPGGRVGGRGV